MVNKNHIRLCNNLLKFDFVKINRFHVFQACTRNFIFYPTMVLHYAQVKFSMQNLKFPHRSQKEFDLGEELMMNIPFHITTKLVFESLL
jgi:hypothetical protein